MELQIDIGINSNNEIYKVDLLRSHTFISYCYPGQLQAILEALFVSARNHPITSMHFAVALSKNKFSTSLISNHDIKMSFLVEDEKNSKVKTRTGFMRWVGRELTKRIKTNKSLPIKMPGLPPLVIIMDDVLDFIVTANRNTAKTFIHLLSIGASVGIYLVAASGSSYRSWLKQFMYAQKHSPAATSLSILNKEPHCDIELVFTSDGFIFCKQAPYIDYVRLYPTKEQQHYAVEQEPQAIFS